MVIVVVSTANADSIVRGPCKESPPLRLTFALSKRTVSCIPAFHSSDKIKSPGFLCWGANLPLLVVIIFTYAEFFNRQFKK
ncbi:MAG: hypothetical protein EAZ78_07660 [Oscillatoriales cyanobacterium]|nr:MAG: hypothetical protein EAZ78_07660 [Oscillatoriales cyanobacterium]